MRALFILATLLFTSSIFAQLYKPVDTIVSKSESQKLLKFFESKTKELEQEFRAYDVVNKKLIKDFVSSRKEMMEGLTKENYLLFDKELEEYFNNQFKQVAQKNNIPVDGLRVFLSRDTSPNAYSMGDGIFVFHLSLLALLENEEELNFIIGHELAHYHLQHLQNRFKKAMEVASSEEYAKQNKEIKKSRYNRFTRSLEVYREMQYGNSSISRLRELEADSLSFVLMKAINKNPYNAITALEKSDTLSLPEILKVNLDMLKVHFSTDKLPFDDEWTSGYDFSKYNYQTGKVDIFGIHKDSLRSHPEMEERISRLKELLPKGSELSNSETDNFIKLKEKIRLENVYAHYCLEEYGRGIYLIIQLQNSDFITEKERLFYSHMLSLFYGKLADARKAFKFKKYVDEIDVVNFSEEYKLFLTILDNLRSSELQELSKGYAIK